MTFNITVTTPELAAKNEPILFLAGHVAPAGVYRMFGGVREVHLDTEGMLPASLDGRVAVYQRRGTMWADRRGYGDYAEMTDFEVEDSHNESFPST